MGCRALSVFCIGVFLPGLALAQGAGDPPAPSGPPAPAPSAQPVPAQPPPGPPGTPPPQYYVEPPPAAGGEGPPRSAQGPYEPPPPGYGYPEVWEPPPPPKPHHRAPKTALWLGPRVGWFVPFGSLWAKSDNVGNYSEVRWSDYASSGPMFELDAGMRFSRYYNVFFAWERALLGAGSAEAGLRGGQKAGDSDYYAIGLRFSSDPDRVGFLTEVNIGYRRFRAAWADGTELQLTEAPLEFRIGIGADIRVSSAFSLSPMITLGAGAFGKAEWVAPNGTRTDAQGVNDQGAGHGWLTLQLGAHFDLFGGD